MDSLEDFSLAVSTNGRGSVVHIMGELDMATAPQLQECLVDLDGETVTLDFSGMTFMDSSGIAVLAWAMKRGRHGGAELHVRGMHPEQMRLLEITEMIDELIFDG